MDTKEFMKSNLDEIMATVCKEWGIDRVTLYSLLDEMMEEDGLIEYSLETLH